MCVAALPAILGVASAGMSFVGQVQAANAQNDAANRNIQNARQAYMQEITDNTRNFRARAVETQQKRFDATLEAREKQGQAIAMASSTGTAGNSVSAVRNALLSKASENDFRIASAFEQNQLMFESAGKTAHARAKDRIYSIPYAAMPNPLGLAINAASAVFA